jgi:hypothetical protein
MDGAMLTWTVASLSLWTAGTLFAQGPVFRSAATFSVSGASTDTTSQIVVADVGSPDGQNPGPDGVPDVVTAAQNQQASVLLGRGDGRFRTGPNTNLGRIPTAIAVGPFDEDEFPDLLVTDTGNTLTFFRGFSDGPPFDQVGDPIEVGRSPVAIAQEDFDDDGALDVAIVNAGGQGQGELRLFLGNGDGTFAPPPPPADTMASTGVGSAAVAVGDFDADGDFDFAVANAGSNDVSIIHSGPGGTLTLAQTAPVDDEPVSVAAGDLDGDTVVDLVVTNRVSDTVSTLRGRGDGTFDASRSFASGSQGSAPTGLALADFNLDGGLDAAVPNNFSSDVSVLLGDGEGGFGRPRVFAADEQTLGVAVGSFNDDPFIDVAAVSRGSTGPNVASMLSVGDGSLEAVEDLIAEMSPVDAAVGDLDNNGVADISLVHSDGTLLAYLAKRDTAFAVPLELELADDTAAVTHADLNQDGRLDIIAASKAGREVAVLLARANGGFAPPQSFSLTVEASALAVGDWNADRVPDVAATGLREGSVGGVDILLGAPDGSLGSPTSLDAGGTPVDMESGDLNGDDRMDLVVANNASNNISVFLSNGDGTFTTATPVAAAGGPKSLTIADFDRDGCDDLAVALAISRSVITLFGDCAGSLAADGFPLALRGTPSAVEARDLTGDGLPDLLVADEVSNSVSVFVKTEGNRFFLQLNENEFVVSRRPIDSAVGDFDGDGAYDGAAVNSFVAGSVSVLTNILAPPLLRGDANGDERVTAADTLASLREVVDGDGVRVEDVARGTYAAADGVDANGDGIITAQDAMGVSYRVFEMF